jgi:transposase
VLEASTESEWLARHLESLGHEVIVVDPNFAPMYATRSRKVKTDKRDARTLCQACLLGACRPAHRCDDDSRLLRKHLRAREALVQTRSRMISVCRAFLRQEGVRVPSAGAPGFAQRVRALKLAQELRETLEPLLQIRQQMSSQIEVVDEKVKQVVATDERVH